MPRHSYFLKRNKNFTQNAHFISLKSIKTHLFRNPTCQSLIGYKRLRIMAEVDEMEIDGENCVGGVGVGVGVGVGGVAQREQCLSLMEQIVEEFGELKERFFAQKLEGLQHEMDEIKIR
jgi:hypothetical protein